MPWLIPLRALTLFLLALGLNVCRIHAQTGNTPCYFANFVGLPGGIGNADGTGANARFWLLRGIALDGGGNIYVADSQNDTIRRVAPDGTVTTIAGTPTSKGSADGIGSLASFYQPWGVAVDGSGTVYVADTSNQTIRKITPGQGNWTVTTLAGAAGQAGSTDGTGSAAQFHSPTGVAVDTSGNIYVADRGNNTIRYITQAGAVTTLAGSAGLSGTNDGIGSAARFYQPTGVAVDTLNRVYVADAGGETVRMVTLDGTVTTFAGRGWYYGSADGVGSSARFNSPTGIAVDGAGNLYVADYGNNTIRFITPAGAVTTLAGTAGQAGSADGTATDARFANPFSVAVAGSGLVYVGDYGNSTVRQIAPGPTVTTLAGTATHAGSADGTLTAARFSAPTFLAFGPSGNLYVSDTGNNTIRQVTPAGVVTTLAGSPGLSGSTDGVGSSARFNSPVGITVDAWGTVYVADQNNATIRKITPDGAVTTLAGTAGRIGSQDGPSWAASFNYPSGLAVDPLLNVYVCDDVGFCIRKVTATGDVSTIAGSSVYSGYVDGVGTAARFNGATAIALDPAGHLFVLDLFNAKIRQLSLVGTNWVVTTVTGGSGIFGGYGLPAMALDTAGNFIVADSADSVIRKLTPSGGVTTLAGRTGYTGAADGLGSAALFTHPSGVAVDSAGNIYVADSGNNRISIGSTLRLQFASGAGAITVSNALFHTHLSGPLAADVVVEATSDFKSWTPIQTNTLLGSGVDLSVPLTTNLHQSFRARLP